MVTSYKKYLHPQHVVDRFLDGYGWNGTYHRPEMDVVSLYVDQRGEGDLFQERADRHPGMKICPTIEEALTLGTGKLAVDGVVVVAEHGVYPLSENGIMMRPALRVLRADHQGIPRQRPLGPLLQRQRALVELGLVEEDGRRLARVELSASGRLEPRRNVESSVRRVSTRRRRRRKPSLSAMGA